MRTEVKIAIAVGLVVVIGAGIWMTSTAGNGARERTEIPLNRGVFKDPSGDRTGLAEDSSPLIRQNPPVQPPPGSTGHTESPRAANAGDSSPRTEPRTSSETLPPRPTPTDASPTVSPPERVPATTDLRPAVDRPQTPGSSTRPAATPLVTSSQPIQRGGEGGSRPFDVSGGTPTRTSDRPSVAVPPRGESAPRTEPPAGSPARPQPIPGSGTRYTVQEGDTLIYIARDQYGDDRYWQAIVQANPGVDPNHLRVGQSIVLPPKDQVLSGRSAATPAKPAAVTSQPSNTRAPSPTAQRSPTGSQTTPPTSTRPTTGGNRTESAPAARATYIVGKGDTLISIARAVLKDENRWREIYELNKDKLRSPDVLYEGLELRLPSAERNGNRRPAERKAIPRNRTAP